MKKGLMYKAIVIITGVVLAGAAYAADMDHSAHGANGDAMDKPFHESMVAGYHLTYKLIDMKAKMKDMAGMDEMKATHHLMMFISKKHETHTMPVTEAKIGFLVEDPDGNKKTSMCMAMSGGFGADINLGKKGIYTIKAKLVDGDTKLIDEFKHTVK